MTLFISPIKHVKTNEVSDIFSHCKTMFDNVTLNNNKETSVYYLQYKNLSSHEKLSNNSKFLLSYVI